MKQPEALRLADEISKDLSWVTNWKAADELRHLHEANQAMLEALKKFSEYEAAMDAGNDIDGMLLYAELQAMSRAAIAKGKEK